jgi:hypothetical protein
LSALIHSEETFVDLDKVWKSQILWLHLQILSRTKLLDLKMSVIVAHLTKGGFCKLTLLAISDFLTTAKIRLDNELSLGFSKSYWIPIMIELNLLCSPFQKKRTIKTFKSYQAVDISIFHPTKIS